MAERELTLDMLQQSFEEIAEVPSARAAIGVSDPEAAPYVRALEYGSIAGQPPWPHPGPRTLLAVDPESGAQVVVSAQAPQGFIRVRAPELLDHLLAELAQPADWFDAAAVEVHVQQAVGRAALAALEELRTAAPRDSGRLSQSLTLIPE